jgi:hypothetical protein
VSERLDNLIARADRGRLLPGEVDALRAEVALLRRNLTMVTGTLHLVDLADSASEQLRTTTLQKLC